ncbi:hypothetical protein Misp01_46210 [Microtetraspora sp. NBRC 13810]|uniref:serine/threonine-protein kinase n=1 Tax=Microtetraspora sp. NBRC 13810 TaxID=3030990 RepID=UPI0024A15F53|nr:protein kinase [Microtetraspora sp. NBRC 13810]GLW09492.1 hypothetical protein Misp01_46210 [Microtetraspora sp. NBRC 13810]
MAGGPLQPGDPRALGAFQVVARLGEGGQGVVYEGRDASGGRVAIKVLRGGTDPGTRRRLARELESARRVAPFCTARVLAAELDRPDPYVVSEFVAGPSLQERVRDGGPLRDGDLDRLAVGTASALAAIHAAGVVHSDFKPANVLLGPDGPRVVDFGIARPLDAATAPSSLSGTPPYMAPEQLRGEHGAPSADVFAWAATMVYAATGRAPFGSDTVAAVFHRILSQDPDLDGVPPTLRTVLATCLSKDPAARPAARTLLVHLVDPTAGPAATHPPGAASRTTTPYGPGVTAPPGYGDIRVSGTNVSANVSGVTVPGTNVSGTLVSGPGISDTGGSGPGPAGGRRSRAWPVVSVAVVVVVTVLVAGIASVYLLSRFGGEVADGVRDGASGSVAAGGSEPAEDQGASGTGNGGSGATGDRSTTVDRGTGDQGSTGGPEAARDSGAADDPGATGESGTVDDSGRSGNSTAGDSGRSGESGTAGDRSVSGPVARGSSGGGIPQEFAGTWQGRVARSDGSGDAAVITLLLPAGRSTGTYRDGDCEQPVKLRAGSRGTSLEVTVEQVRTRQRVCVGGDATLTLGPAGTLAIVRQEGGGGADYRGTLRRP